MGTILKAKNAVRVSIKEKMSCIVQDLLTKAESDFKLLDARNRLDDAKYADKHSDVFIPYPLTG